jgi:hypothetical protein
MRPSSRTCAARISRREAATFWVYSAYDAASTIDVDLIDDGTVELAVNGKRVGHVQRRRSAVAVSLSGGVNKVTLTGMSHDAVVDRLVVTQSDDALPAATYEAEDAARRRAAHVAPLSLASGGLAVDGIGGTPGNGNDLTFTVSAKRTGTYAMRVRYSNPEQSPASHYNPDPLARRADIAVNGGAERRALFPHSFHQNNFWELTVRVPLKRGRNTIRFSSEEQPNFDGKTYASDTWTEFPLRSKYAPLIDKITIAPFAGRLSGRN